jgi:MFS family permease
MAVSSGVPAKWLTRGVLAIGLASLMSDLGHEPATAILPLFIISIGGSPLALGLVEGVADFAASGAKLWAGYIGGSLRHKKPAAAAGYVVTALSTGALTFATAWGHVLVFRAIAWVGRGFRTPLRDTLLAEQTARDNYGKAFGFERAMDASGAILGPIVALALLSLALPLRTIFLVSFFPGLVAGFVILTATEHGVIVPSRSFWHTTVTLPATFRRFLVAVGVFGAGDFSRTLLILWALGVGVQITNRGQMTLPLLLYVAYNSIGAASALVAGVWSDRIGRRTLLLSGYALAAAVSVLMSLDRRPLPILLAVFLGSGVFIGIQEALERATAADLLPTDTRAFGFGALSAVNGLGDLVSSSLVGFLWQRNGAAVAFGTAAALSLAGAILLATIPLPRHRPG